MKPLTKKKFNTLNINDYRKSIANSVNQNASGNKPITPKATTTTSVASSTTPSENAQKGLNASLYQEYLNKSNANLKSQATAYTDQQIAYKYANDMLKQQGLANSGQASSLYAGINNNYLNQVNQAQINQQQLDKEYALQESEKAYELATDELSMGINKDDVYNRYSQYLNEQDKLKLDSYIRQTEKTEKQAIFNKYGISEANELKGFVYGNQFYDEYSDIINDSANNGRVVTFDDINGYYVIYNGKLYSISKNTYKANESTGLGRIKSRNLKTYNENAR